MYVVVHKVFQFYMIITKYVQSIYLRLYVTHKSTFDTRHFVFLDNLNSNMIYFVFIISLVRYVVLLCCQVVDQNLGSLLKRGRKVSIDYELISYQYNMMIKEIITPSYLEFFFFEKFNSSYLYMPIIFVLHLNTWRKQRGN